MTILIILLAIGLQIFLSGKKVSPFLPPHPGPVVLINAFKADVDKTLLYGICIAIPAVIIAGPLLGRQLKKIRPNDANLYASAMLEPATKELLLKNVNTSGKEQACSYAVAGFKKLHPQAKLYVVESNDLNGIHFFDEAIKVPVKESVISIKRMKSGYTLPAYSVNRIQFRFS